MTKVCKMKFDDFYAHFCCLQNKLVDGFVSMILRLSE